MTSKKDCRRQERSPLHILKGVVGGGGGGGGGLGGGGGGGGGCGVGGGLGGWGTHSQECERAFISGESYADIARRGHRKNTPTSTTTGKERGGRETSRFYKPGSIKGKSRMRSFKRRGPKTRELWR